MSDVARALLDELTGDGAALDRLADALAERVADRVAARSSVRPALMTVIEVAKVLGCHPATVRRRIADGAIPAVREGERVVITAHDLRAYLEHLDRVSGEGPARRRRASSRRDYSFLIE